MAGRKKYDWTLIRDDYVWGYDGPSGHVWPTFEDLSERHGCAASSISRRARAVDKDGLSWTQARQAAQLRVQAERDTIRTKEVAELVNRLESVSLQNLERLIGLVALGLMNFPEDLSPLKAARDIRDLSHVQKTALDMLGTMLGETSVDDSTLDAVVVLITTTLKRLEVAVPDSQVRVAVAEAARTLAAVDKKSA